MVESDVAGCRIGVVAADRALCCAAADGGLVLVLAEREGLTSVALFFRDLPGPVDRDVGFSGGRTGDDSLEGSGELLAEVDRLGCSCCLFVVDAEVGSRAPLDNGPG